MRSELRPRKLNLSAADRKILEWHGQTLRELANANIAAVKAGRRPQYPVIVRVVEAETPKHHWTIQ